MPKSEGYLEIQSNGRFAIVDINDESRTNEITSGEVFEIKVFGKWVTVRMEHDGEMYYIYGEESCFYPKRVYARQR
jgi:hypothetical protein